jgi:hypothetical protein
MFLDLREWLLKPVLPAIVIFSAGTFFLEYLKKYHYGWMLAGGLSCICGFLVASLFYLNKFPQRPIQKI